MSIIKNAINLRSLNNIKDLVRLKQKFECEKINYQHNKLDQENRKITREIEKKQLCSFFASRVLNRF